MSDTLNEAADRLIEKALSQAKRIKELEAERDFARDNVASKCRQYDADMQIMQTSLNREITRIKELEAALRETERVRDEWCAEYVRLRDCAQAVCWFDWSSNDTDAVEAIDKLQYVLDYCWKST